jgi:hypothetical protein
MKKVQERRRGGTGELAKKNYPGKEVFWKASREKMTHCG